MIHVFAYTSPREDMPPYVNLSDAGREGVLIMVRGPQKPPSKDREYPTYGDTAHATLPREEARKLYDWLGAYLRVDVTG